MRSFFRKMYICLFEPRMIGVFLGEKLYKSFLQLLLLTLIAISPLIVQTSLKNEISNASFDAIETQLMVNIKNTDLTIKNNTFSGSDGVAFFIEEAIIFLNPTNKSLKLNFDEEMYHIIEFFSEGLKVTYFGNIVFSKTYDELGVEAIDFYKISRADYLELDKFINLVNIAFKEFKVIWTLENILFNFIFVYFNVILTALLLALIIRMVNPIIAFKYRLKGALDVQVISLLSILLTMLFDAEFIRYIGVIASVIYLFIAMVSIIRIEVQKSPFKNNDKEE